MHKLQFQNLQNFKTARFLLLVMALLSLAQAPSPDPIQQTDIIFWHSYSHPTYAEFFQSQADAFNASQRDYVVTVQFYPSYFNQHDALLRALVNGGLPHVALVQNYDAALYQQGDALLDLAEYIDLTDFYDEMLATDTYNGQQLGIPLGRGSMAMYVNRDLLPNDVAYDDLASVGCDADLPLDPRFWRAITYSPDIYDGERYQFTHWEAVLRSDWLQCASINTDGRAAPLNRFASGQTAIYFDDTSARPFVMDAISTYYAEPFPLPMVPLPTAQGDVAALRAPSLSIFDDFATEEIEASLDWVEWLTRPTTIAEWAALANQLPSHANAEVPENIQSFANAIPLRTPNTSGYGLIRDESLFALQRIRNGADISETLSLLEATAADIHAVLP